MAATPPQPTVPYDFAAMVDLEARGPDTFVGQSGPFPWGRIYGGQVIAQALWAAAATVEPDHVVHSLHGYFILGGKIEEPVRFEVDRLRNGRSFSTRRVVARQSDGAILNMSSSFHRREPDADVQTVPFPQDVPEPESLPEGGWGWLMERRQVPIAHGAGDAMTWVRVPNLGADEALRHACALALASDTSAVSASRAAHPAGAVIDASHHSERFMGASLDHAVWFHRPMAADEWMLIDFSSRGLRNARGLAVGHVFDRSGTHVATIAQEALLRERRPKS